MASTINILTDKSHNMYLNSIIYYRLHGSGYTAGSDEDSLVMMHNMKSLKLRKRKRRKKIIKELLMWQLGMIIGRG